MKQFFIKNNSNKLLLFFSGWGCDEHEFEHLRANSDVLIFYDYTNLNYNFDFSKYSEINMLAFSAGVFIGSIFKHAFKINKKIALSGNPYLFDEKLGLSNDIQNVLTNITVDNCNDFAKNYLVKTDDEYKNFHNSNRTLESCNEEFEALKSIYHHEYQNIKDTYNIALIGDNDPIFNPENQKLYYKDRLTIIKNARHNIFFRVTSFDEIINLRIQ